jgi:hypothetical protein
VLPPLWVQGTAATAVQWGAFGTAGAGGGMAARHASTSVRVVRMGMALLTPHQGLRAFQGLLAGLASTGTFPLTAAVPFLWTKFLQGGHGVAPMFAELVPEAPAAVEAGAAGRAPRAAAVQPLAEQRAAIAAEGAAAAASVRALVLAAVEEVLGTRDVGADQPLMAAGMAPMHTRPMMQSCH